MKNIVPFLSLASLSTGSFVLVGYDKSTNVDAANDAPKLEPRHKGWKSRFWHDDEDEEGHTRTVTITVTVTVTQILDLLPTGEAPSANISTTSIDNGTFTTSVDNPAPISLSDIDTLLPTSFTESDNSLPSSTDVVDVEPIPNDIAPITLIDLGSIQARAAKETKRNG